MTQLQHESAQPVWNLGELLLRVENDDELLRDLLHIFRDDFPPLLGSLQSAVAAADLKNIATVSHTLRGMLSNLAATRAATIAEELEKLAKAGDPSSIGSVLVRLRQETSRLNGEIEAYLNGVRA